jgi:antitoxin ChpS
MHSTNLRRVGGSVMVAIPPVLLNMVGMEQGERVGISAENGRLIIQPKKRHHYTLDELLAKCKPNASRSRQDRAWLDDEPIGKEITGRDLAGRPRPIDRERTEGYTAGSHRFAGTV